jgi:hypothetical protein
LQTKVALQALEFWSTLCEEEADIKVISFLLHQLIHCIAVQQMRASALPPRLALLQLQCASVSVCLWWLALQCQVCDAPHLYNNKNTSMS